RSARAAPAASMFVVKGGECPYVLAFSMEVICLLADAAAACTDFFPVRICVSMFRSTFAFSTLAQFLAVGTNHVDCAACASCLPGVPETRLRRDVLLGRLPDFTIPCSPALLVNAAIHSFANVLSVPPVDV